MNRFTLLLAIASSFLLMGVATTDNKVIYGDDDRIDVYKVQDRAIYELTQSTVAMIPKSSITVGRSGVTFNTGTLGSSFGLCSDEPFFNQPNAANCSGFLVGDDLIATAGHCINDSTCSNYSFVFSYEMKDENTAPTSTSTDNVYNCQEVVKRELTRRQDYALIRLDRPVVGRTPVKLRMTGSATVGDEVMVIGHPSGIPTKVAAGALVRTVENDNSYFTASLDTYGGNSGSAVFNTRTLEVEGILVRGENDYTYDYQNSCRRSNHCTMTGCRGEDVSDIHYIVDAMN